MAGTEIKTVDIYVQFGLRSFDEQVAELLLDGWEPWACNEQEAFIDSETDQLCRHFEVRLKRLS